LTICYNPNIIYAKDRHDADFDFSVATQPLLKSPIKS
jgi:hypothetical protein